MITQSKVIHTSFSKVWLGDDGICRVVLQPYVVVGLAEMQENLAAQKKVIGKGKGPVLVDMRAINNSTHEAREFGAGEEFNQVVTAVAIIENTRVGEILGNLFINFSNPLFPTNMFTSEEKAVEWLKEFI